MAVLPVYTPKPAALEIRRGGLISHFRHLPHGGVVITTAPEGPGMAYRLRLNDEEVQWARKFFGAPAEHVPSVGAAVWDEDRQLARVTVDDIPFNNHGHSTAADCRLVAAARRRAAAAFDAMADVLEAREESERDAEYQLKLKRQEAIKAAGYPLDYDQAGASVRRLVDMLVDAQESLDGKAAR